MRGPLVVIGDSLLDVDVEGDAERLCPDAPVPVVDVAAEQARPGGAGLAALLAARDGADVVLITAMGDDPDGHRLCGLLSEELDLVRLPLRGGTVRKTRIRSKGQTLVRLDTGDGAARYAPSEEAAQAILRAGAVLVSDYGRGVARMARGLLHDVSVPVVWDPHPRGERPMPGCALVTPSEAEARLLCPDGYHGPDQAARRLVRAMQARAVAVTTGERGAALAVEGGPLTTVPPPVRAAGQDACGAGDRFAAAAALALRDGTDVQDAVTIGVGEASRFVERGGAATVKVREQRLGDRPRTALEVAELTRAQGGRLIATGGCFDLLHAGHVSLLRRARALGDALVVCVNSDDSVRRLKGPPRPVVDARDRVEVLRALSCVDAVLVFDEDTPAAAIERLRPDVWVKGGDYEGEVLPESEVLGRLGAETVVLSTLPGRSTTNLIKEIQ
ncbi:bifunctional heptose 7-phosphate kinase/heptose 1-phosphate adenyltransferase [Nonomuraea sp. KC401]|uniref:Bifunctional heptose 7-phosphate kinase/heptose 1-phosphate adenyltransferase n=1 Tax=Nonomuraea longispora TaxID=1848320 RepID=A0A4R4N4J4_9ACTN|nr:MULTISPECIES: PfkB family carbohydrate kinase [Nonomuraea]NBE95892.1 adenylyltransferase/cytidyltransferase family protein [Nonomuraea sp. K271]TDC03721.1 bifunctional heptose 7-phosphate kinase/heptose 1-phosphate adenyltransferase [Nonomuraea longispora]TLF83480.1 bifunctional heptose 7-phosphate kinase/heptose 1-phosphate adenyltransferase [Nonomuraea sp. KC401]